MIIFSKKFSNHILRLGCCQRSSILYNDISNWKKCSCSSSSSSWRRSSQLFFFKPNKSLIVVFLFLETQYHNCYDVFRWISNDVQSLLLDILNLGHCLNQYCLCFLDLRSRFGYNYLSYDTTTIKSRLMNSFFFSPTNCIWILLVFSFYLFIYTL